MVPQLSQVETLQTVSKHVALSVAAMEAPKKKPRVDKQGRATANYVQRTLETLHHAREQHIYSRSWPSSVFHDTLRPSDKAGWFAAAYFVLSLLQAQLQAFWHWVEESPLPVGAVATTDCITFLMQLKQRNPSLGKIPPALIAALAWVHPHVQIVSTWGKSATEVLRTQLKSAVRSIKQSVGASASSTTAAAPMPPTDCGAPTDPRISEEHQWKVHGWKLDPRVRFSLEWLGKLQGPFCSSNSLWEKS